MKTINTNVIQKRGFIAVFEELNSKFVMICDTMTQTRVSLFVNTLTMRNVVYAGPNGKTKRLAKADGITT